MSEPQAEAPNSPPPRRGTTPLVVALIALVASAGLWLQQVSRTAADQTRAEELGRMQRQLVILEERIERERVDLARLAQTMGTEGQASDSLTARIGHLEDAVGHLSGSGEQIRFTWLIAQTEYYLRIANAQESLAGDAASALTALQLADDHLRDAGDPRMVKVRQLLAGEIAALRALPKMDREGIALKLGTLARELPSLRRKQSVSTRFDRHDDADPGNLSGWDRLVIALRKALFSVVSVRRSDAPATPLMSDEGIAILLRSLDLELQMARLAALRGETDVFRSSVKSVAARLAQYFDAGTPEVAAALATLNELAATPLPHTLPDVSASLTQLLRIKEREIKR